MSKPLILIGCPGNRNAKFAKKYSKIISSEAIRGIKLKLCINVHSISLYKKYVFIAAAHVLSSLWQLKRFHRHIMGKVKVGLYCYLTADISTRVLHKCSLSNPLQNLLFLSKPLNLIRCHGNRKARFKKINKNIISSEAITGITFAEMFVRLASTKREFFLLLLVVCFHCCGNITFPLAYNGKRDSWPLLLSHDILIKVLQKSCLFFQLLPWQLKS